MNVRTYKRCGCRGEDGKQLKACPDLTKRTHGAWSARVELPRVNGKRRQLEKGGFRTKAEAEAWADTIQEAQKKGAVNLDQRLTVGEWLDIWFAARTSPSGVSIYGKTLRASTAAVYALHIRYLKEHLGGVGLLDLTPEHVAEAYAAIQAASAAEADRIDAANAASNAWRVAHGREPIDYPPAKRVGPTSVKRIHACLSSAMKAAVKSGRKPFNPCLQVMVEAAPARERTPWTDEQHEKFLEGTREHPMGILFAFLMWSGARRGEALGLEWNDVDLNRGAVHIRRQLLNAWQDGAPVFGPPKTDRGERWITLPAEYVDDLRLHRLKQDDDRERWGDAYDDSGLVFCQENGRPYDPSKVTKTFASLTKAQGLPHIHLHDLRHGAITRWLSSGTDVHTVSRKAGHSNISTTNDIYGHWDEQADRRAAEAGYLRVSGRRAGAQLGA